MDRELDNRIGWVVAGGESGRLARPAAGAWFRSLRDQCVRHEVPFHFKQWGGVQPKANGHALDGAEYRAFPTGATA
jgi:protein gp37